MKYECLTCHYIFPEEEANSEYGWLCCPNEDCGDTELLIVEDIQEEECTQKH